MDDSLGVSTLAVWIGHQKHIFQLKLAYLWGMGLMMLEKSFKYVDE